MYQICNAFFGEIQTKNYKNVAWNSRKHRNFTPLLKKGKKKKRKDFVA